MQKIKEFLMKLIANKIIDQTTGKEAFEKSKTKIGVILYAVTFLIDVVLPAFGIILPVSDKIIKVAEMFGITMTGYGLRDAQQKAIVAASKN